MTFICFWLHHADTFSFSSFYKNEINCSVIHAGKRKFSILLFYWYCCAVLFWIDGIFPVQNLTWPFLGFIFFSFHSSWTSCTFFFVVSSGLNLAPVARLRTTWEKLPSKYEKLFQDLQDLFDPSRNMAKYRNVLNSQNLQPPIIPLFPVIKKDLTFLHEGKNRNTSSFTG